MSQLHLGRAEGLKTLLGDLEDSRVYSLNLLACVCWATISCSGLPQHTGIVPRVI